MSDPDREMGRLLKTLIQKVQRERAGRVELDAAELAYITDHEADGPKVDELRSTLRKASSRVKHDSYITDAAVKDAEAFLNPHQERVA